MALIRGRSTELDGIDFGLGLGIAGRNLERSISSNKVGDVEEEEEEQYDELHLCLFRILVVCCVTLKPL